MVTMKRRGETIRARRQTLRLCLLCSFMATAAAFCNVETRRNTQQQALCSTTLPDPPPPSSSSKKIESESTFWHSIIRRDCIDQDDDNERIPCEPSLDAQGPLPAGAYQILGNEENEPKPTCRLSIAVDSTFATRKQQLSRLHQFIDCGLTTFQFQNDEEGTCRRLRADTPDTVLRSCQFIIPFQTPSTSILAQPSLVREQVLEILRRTGGDCIDTLQLEYTPGSQYHLDVLDVLTDLQREGLLRSIATKDFPPQLLRLAVKCGFRIDTNQISCNLLNASQYTRELQLACQDLGIQLLVSNPLAGDFLTSKFSNTQYEPQPWDLSPEERRILDKVVTPWAKKLDSDEHRWKVYQSKMMDTLDDIALKYRVSTESVSLRWAMQLKHVASVIVPCEMGEESDDRPFEQPEKLRQVFRFELDEEDMDRLWEASGEADLVKEPEFNSVAGLENLDFDEEDDGLFLPDLSNNKLWL